LATREIDITKVIFLVKRTLPHSGYEADLKKFLRGIKRKKKCEPGNKTVPKGTGSKGKTVHGGPFQRGRDAEERTSLEETSKERNAEGKKKSRVGGECPSDGPHGGGRLCKWGRIDHGQKNKVKSKERSKWAHRLTAHGATGKSKEKRSYRGKKEKSAEQYIVRLGGDSVPEKRQQG